jgi:hypothetical protein
MSLKKHQTWIHLPGLEPMQVLTKESIQLFSGDEISLGGTRYHVASAQHELHRSDYFFKLSLTDRQVDAPAVAAPLFEAALALRPAGKKS